MLGAIIVYNSHVGVDLHIPSTSPFLQVAPFVFLTSCVKAPYIVSIFNGTKKDDLTVHVNFIYNE